MREVDEYAERLPALNAFQPPRHVPDRFQATDNRGQIRRRKPSPTAAAVRQL